MRIVVLDGYTLNPGDLSWSPLQAFGSCEVYDRTKSDEVISRAAEAEIVLTNKTELKEYQIALLPKLRYIGVLATGFNVVDIKAARARNIPVTNVPGYSTRSVAQLTFALLLELANRTGDHAKSVEKGDWSRCPDFSYWNFPLVELDGKTIGIIGFGNIGKAVAQIAQAFGMNVLVHTRTKPSLIPEGYQFVELDQLFCESDVVSLHTPLTPQTQHLINRERIGLMKCSAFLINTSRGPLIDEAALAEALDEERVAGAGLDVLSQEPPPVSNSLLKAKNCFITPHIGWATQAARMRLLNAAVENIKAFLSGAPQNVVN